MPRIAERARDTAARVSFARMGRRTRRRRLPRQIEPRAIEREYARVLLAEFEAVIEELQPLLDELPQLAAAAIAERADAGEGERVRILMEGIAARINARMSTSGLDEIARKFAAQTSTFQRLQLLRQTRAALGVDVFAADNGLRALVDGFASENVSLIKSLPTRTFSEIERLTTRGLASATPHVDIAKQIQERLAVGRDRARLIARDQIGKLYGQVNHTRQKALGVRRFVWRTANDERVRDEHEALDDRTFSYDDPPSEGLPGQPILCRCYAEPVFDEIIGASDA